MARRVAEEQGTDVGHRVGYAVRFEERCSPATRIKYLTGGVPSQVAHVSAQETCMSA